MTRGPKSMFVPIIGLWPSIPVTRGSLVPNPEFIDTNDWLVVNYNANIN